MAVVEIVIDRAEILIGLEKSEGTSYSGNSRLNIAIAEDYWARKGAPWPASLGPTDLPATAEWHIMRSSLLQSADDAYPSVLHRAAFLHPGFPEFVETHQDDMCFGIAIPETRRAPAEAGAQETSDAHILLSLNDDLFAQCARQIERIQSTPDGRLRLVTVVRSFPTKTIRAEWTPEHMLEQSIYFDVHTQQMLAYTDRGSILFECGSVKGVAND